MMHHTTLRNATERDGAWIGSGSELCGTIPRMNEPALIAFQFIVLIFSVMIHEISHGVMAERLGDPTARDAGRLTLNPLKHIDPFGSIFLPLLLVVAHSPFVIGWAKPVPYDPRYLKNPKSGAAKIAAAGPLSNFLIAIIFSVLLRVLPSPALSEQFQLLVSIIIFMNVLLAIFNLIPIPPLDGSKVLYAFMPETQTGYAIMSFLERYGFVLLVAFLLWGSEILWYLTNIVYVLIAGGAFG